MGKYYKTRREFIKSPFKLGAYKSSDEMRIRSGMEDSNNSLVAFLYVLIRDHVTPGNIEEIILVNCNKEKSQYSNGWLAKYAKDVANRLTRKRK